MNSLAVDASGYGICAVISHKDSVNENPTIYMLRSTPAEKNY